jgi:hypothetical protein
MFAKDMKYFESTNMGDKHPCSSQGQGGSLAL